MSTGQSKSSYTTDAHGELGGLPGWIRILRDGNPVHYCPTQADADTWIAQTVRP